MEARAGAPFNRCQDSKPLDPVLRGILDTLVQKCKMGNQVLLRILQLTGITNVHTFKWEPSGYVDTLRTLTSLLWAASRSRVPDSQTFRPSRIMLGLYWASEHPVTADIVETLMLYHL